MLSGIEVRDRVRNGLTTGKLWRLTRDHAKLQGATDGNRPCHVCDQRIPWGQAYALERASAQFVVHLECYVFWLYECGLFEAEPRLCAACRRLIPPHAETATIAGEAYHGRCWDRAAASPAGLALAVPLIVPDRAGPWSGGGAGSDDQALRRLL